MKKINLILVMMLLISSSVFAQWTTGGSMWNRFGATKWAIWGNNNIRSIGIGHKQMFGGFIEGWTTGNPPRAALHVNDFYLDDPQSWVFTPGQVFRTDGPSNQDNMWQMFTGNNYGNSTEKARLYVLANSQHFSLQSSTGDMRFHTGGTTQRMRILGSNGFVAIGQNFNNPQSLLSIDGTNDNTGEVFRTNGSNADTTIWRFCQGNNEIAQFFSLPDSKDFIIGVDDVSSSIKINTGLLQKIIIKDSYGNTRVGIGNNFSHPQYTLHLHSSSFFPGAPIPSTQIAFTNDHTKSAKTDGFIVGISSTGEAQLKQQENQSMEFYTSNQEQLSITEKGKVVIASLASDTTTYIMADKNGQLHIDEFNAKKKSKNLKNA
ncbi:MAG: hypothetical protein ACP5DZ_10225 [Bacteroidales bacterium]